MERWNFRGLDQWLWMPIRVVRFHLQLQALQYIHDYPQPDIHAQGFEGLMSAHHQIPNDM